MRIGRLFVVSLRRIGNENFDELGPNLLIPSHWGLCFHPLPSNGIQPGYPIPFNDEDTPTRTVALVEDGLTIKGDVDNDGNVDMKDLIPALQVITDASMSPDTIYRGADVTGDKMIGMQDVLYILW